MKPNVKLKLILSSCVAVLMAFGIAACGSAGTVKEGPELAQDAQGILNGTAVGSDTLNHLGLVNVGTGCSGVLLSPLWVLTAQHCLQSVGATQPSFPPISLASGYGSPSTPSSIYFFGQYDVALIALTTPLALPPTAAFNGNTIGTQPASGLLNASLQCYGRGDNALPANGFGTWRTATLVPFESVTYDFWLHPNSAGQIPAAGDSGGPCFYGNALVGIQSVDIFNCASVPAGSTCSESIASSISIAKQAGLGHLKPWIDSIMYPTPLVAAISGGISVIQSRYATAGVDYFWRDNSNPTMPWYFAGAVGTSLGQVDDVSLFQSRQGTMEMAVRKGNLLVQYTRTDGVGWLDAPILISQTAAGRPSFFQSRLGTNGNYELAVPSTRGGLEIYTQSRDSSSGPHYWSGPSYVFMGTGPLYTSAAMFESNLGPYPGDFELFANVGESIQYGFREQVPFPTTNTDVASYRDYRFVGPFMPLGN